MLGMREYQSRVKAGFHQQYSTAAAVCTGSIVGTGGVFRRVIPVVFLRQNLSPTAAVPPGAIVMLAAITALSPVSVSASSAPSPPVLDNCTR